MFKSVIRDGKFLVLEADGIFDVPLLELPTEELADKVAFELQSAWDEGVEWGANQKQKDLLGDESGVKLIDTFRKLRAMTSEEREGYLQNVKRRSDRIQKVEEAKRWRSVLSWKSNENR